MVILFIYLHIYTFIYFHYLMDSNCISLSRKRIKKLTREEFNYELSSNAFDYLNEQVQEMVLKGIESEKIDEWIVKLLGEGINKMNNNNGNIEEI